MARRKRRDDAPLPTLHRLHAILDAVGVGMVAVDGTGRTEIQNAEASRILGISASASVGESLADRLGLRHPLVALLGEVRKTERELQTPGVSLRDRIGGTPLLVDLSASPVVGPEGFAGAVATLHDRTIARELEAFFDQRSRSELFANLAAGIAHEVRNPLAGIRGAAELLQRKLDDPGLRRYPDLIRDEVDRLSRMLDDLAELTSDRNLRTQPVNLHRVLDDLLELHRHDPEWGEVRILREYDPSLPDVEGDPDRLTQVFLNLVRNAVQAMGGRGLLRLATRMETLYQVSEAGNAPVRMVRVEIEDTGPGIPEQDLPHVFTPFFTRRAGGSGLGLPLAQHWVVRHGGRIELGGEAGAGTRTRVLLPVRRPS